MEIRTPLRDFLEAPRASDLEKVPSPDVFRGCGNCCARFGLGHFTAFSYNRLHLLMLTFELCNCFVLDSKMLFSVVQTLVLFFTNYLTVVHLDLTLDPFALKESFSRAFTCKSRLLIVLHMTSVD